MIPGQSAKIAKVFRRRGVAEAYQLFDRPGSSSPDIINRACQLEKALVSPITYLSSEADREDEAFILRYVKIPEAERRAQASAGSQEESQGIPYPLLLAFCVGFRAVGKGDEE